MQDVGDEQGGENVTEDGTPSEQAPVSVAAERPKPQRYRWAARRKRKWAVVAGAVVFLATAGSAVAYFTSEDSSREVVIDLGAPYTLHALPDLVTDLRPTGKRNSHVRVRTLIEVPATDLPVLQANEARIVDAIKTYLRDRQRGDLAGQLGTDRLRTEIRSIVNRNGADGRVRDVLFQELVVD